MRTFITGLLFILMMHSCRQHQTVEDINRVQDSLKKNFGPNLIVGKHWVNKVIDLEVTFTSFRKDRLPEADTLASKVHQYIVNEFPVLDKELDHLIIRFVEPLEEGGSYDHELRSHTYYMKKKVEL